MGPALELKLLELARNLAPDNLKSEVSLYEKYFRRMLRDAFVAEEDGEPELLGVCKSALAECKEIPADAYMAVQRVASDAYKSPHSKYLLDEQALRQLADGPNGADNLAQSIGCPAAAPFIRTMARDLLVSAWCRVMKREGASLGLRCHQRHPQKERCLGWGSNPVCPVPH